MWITWSLCPTEVENKASRGLLRGLAVPLREVVHREHAGLVFRGQELPARRMVRYFLKSGNRVVPASFKVILAGPRE
jgi:hypothetical protein